MKRIMGWALAVALVWTGSLAAAERTSRVALEGEPPRPAVGAPLALPAVADFAAPQVVLTARAVASTGAVSFRGRTADSAYNNVTLTVTPSGFVATIQLPSGARRVYRLANAVWTIRERPPVRGRGRCGAKPPPVRCPSHPHGGPAAKVATPPLTGDPRVDGRAILARGETATNVVDILIGFDQSAARWVKDRSDFAGEADAIALFAADALAKVNATYANTDLDRFFTFNLAGTVVLDVDCSKFRERASGFVDSELILDSLVGNGAKKALFKAVRETREAVSADIVSFLVSCGSDEPEGTVGLGFALDDETIRDPEMCDVAYNVCLIEQVARDTTMAHEIGHNMGAGHAQIKDNASGPQLYGYSTGFYFAVTNAAGVVFRHAASVMAYNSDGYEDDFDNRWGEYPLAVDQADDPHAPRFDSDESFTWNSGMYIEVPFFSSPRHTYRYATNDGSLVDSGVPLGDATHDNTRILSQTYSLAANYRVRGGFVTLSDPQARAASLAGGGATAPGAVAHLRAVASPGFVFAGWYAGYDAATQTFLRPLTARGTDHRAPDFAYTLPSGAPTNLTVYARFVTKTEDARSLSVPALAVQTDGQGRLDYQIPLQSVASLSLPKITLTGLPTGLRFDSRTGMLSGTAKKPGRYPVTLRATNASVRRPLTGTLTLVVPNFVSGLYEGQLNPAADAYPLMAGVRDAESLPSFTVPAGARVAVRGLPRGLKWNARSGTFTGVPTKAGVYTVTITTTRGREKKVDTLTLAVSPFPSWAVGTFNGACAYPHPDGGVVQGIAQFKVSATGALTGKLRMMSGKGRLTSISFRAAALTRRAGGAATASPDAATYVYADVAFKVARDRTLVADLALTNVLSSADGSLMAEQGAGAIVAHDGADGLFVFAGQNPWKRKPVPAVFAKPVGRQVVDVELADDALLSRLSFTFGAKGAVTVKGFPVEASRKAVTTTAQAFLLPLEGPQTPNGDETYQVGFDCAFPALGKLLRVTYELSSLGTGRPAIDHLAVTDLSSP